MKRSIFLAMLLTLVLATSAYPGEALLSGPAINAVVNGCLYLMGVGFGGDAALDGVVGYGVGSGPHDPADDYDGVVDYGVGSGPRSQENGETDGVVGYGAGNGPRGVHGG
jgi:hypothetical protein